MVTGPVSSNVLFSSSSVSVNILAYAQENGGDSDSGGDGGDSDSGDQSTSSPSSTTTTDPASGQSPLGLTFSTENASPSLVEDTEEQDLDCSDVSNRNFEVSSNDPNGFDGDNDGIGCESNDKDSNSGASPISVTSEGPNNDCLFDPDLPKCASNEGECPDGFFNNDDDQCVPEGGCPDGYHTVDDDETGRCIPDSDGCPEGMIFRSDGKTCGEKEIVCEDSPELTGCVDTSCDPSYPDFCLEPNQPDLNCQDEDGVLEPNEISREHFRVISDDDPHDYDRDNDGIGCDKDETNASGGLNSDILNCEDIQGSIKLTSLDPNRLDRDNDGIGCENNGKGGNGNNNDNNDNDNNNNDDNDNSNYYIIMSSDSCNDISDTVELSSEQIEPEEVRTIAYFGNCELDSASLQLNLVDNEDLKLVAANLNDGLSDAVEVEMNQVGQSDSNSNILYEATITDNQEGHDLDTGETKTLNNVNGIVLWNEGENGPIDFADNNFVEANINFFN